MTISQHDLLILLFIYTSIIAAVFFTVAVIVLRKDKN